MINDQRNTTANGVTVTDYYLWVETSPSSDVILALRADWRVTLGVLLEAASFAARASIREHNAIASCSVNFPSFTIPSPGTIISS